MERHLFAGNNTSIGFFSYFDYIISLEEANRIFILKGGPGVGKSTFMKRFGDELASLGHSIEYIHCSSDNESLDGVIITDLKVAIIDGTAPHTVDPKLPGAVDEIINLGVYLDMEQLEKHKNQIMQINKKKTQIYKSAYRFFQCAGLIIDEIKVIYENVTDQEKFKELSKSVIQQIFTKESSNQKLGTIRKLFTEGFTSNGYITHTDSICQDKTVWAIVGENFNSSSNLLGIIAEEAMKRGYFVEGFYRPLNPHKLQHLLLPELNLVILSVNNKDEIINNITVSNYINIDQIMDLNRLRSYYAELNNNKNLYELIIKNALDKLAETKEQHELLEILYYKSMNFKGIDDEYNRIISRYRMKNQVNSSSDTEVAD